MTCGQVISSFCQFLLLWNVWQRTILSWHVLHYLSHLCDLDLERKSLPIYFEQCFSWSHALMKNFKSKWPFNHGYFTRNINLMVISVSYPISGNEMATVFCTYHTARHRILSILAQVMNWCLAATIHLLNQYWFITRGIQDTSHQNHI